MTDDSVFRKCAWRLLPLMMLGYFVNTIDRTNIGFAAFTMNKELGFSPSVFGFGAGLLFVSYSLFELPANLALEKIGARRWIFFLFAAWGVLSAANALIRGPWSFYFLRFALGAAEAGYLPGMLFYLSSWFPKAYIGRFTAVFTAAPVCALVIGGPLAAAIFQLDGVGGIPGWQWLFLLEGLPACVIALAVLKFLPDDPAHAAWLSDDERNRIAARLDAEGASKEHDLLRALRDYRVLLLGLAYGGVIAATYAFALWLPQIVREIGFSFNGTAALLTVIYAIAVVAMIVSGRLSDAKDERVWHFVAIALLTTAALGAASVAKTPIIALIALAASEAGVASAIAAINTLPPLFLRGPAMAGGVAVFGSIGILLGGFGGQYLVGIIRERTGNYSAVLAALAAGMLLSAIIVAALARAIAPDRSAALQNAKGEPVEPARPA
jgi:MFS transporter, ACS family, tartrate transporter